ncbi:MAG TPA: hypothetical protein VF177_08835 [Anaerolineae bacterium]
MKAILLITKKRTRIHLLSFGMVILTFLVLLAGKTEGYFQGKETIIVDPVGPLCGPNSYLKYIGEFHIDWGGPELQYKDFHLISIYSLINPASGSQGRHLELQFVAGKLPDELSGQISGQAPYGARLYQAKYGTIQQGVYEVKALLYNNKKNGQPFAFPTNAGRPDEGDPFIAFAGVETAYPVQEHGSFANDIWNYTITCERETADQPARWVFNAFAPATQSGNSDHDFVVKTYIDGGSWKQEIVGVHSSLDYMLYTNVMIPSGGEYNLDGHLTVDEIEIVADEIDEVVIHSSSGQPWGDFDSGGINDYSPGRYNDPARVDSVHWPFPNQYAGPNGPGVTKPPVWVGWFVKNGKSYDDAFDNVVRDLIAKNVTENYQIRFTSSQGYYPKVFCGPTLTINWSDDKLAYCEMWFSPNAPSFWHGPTGLSDFSGFTMTFTPTLLSQNFSNKTYLPIILN